MLLLEVQRHVAMQRALGFKYRIQNNLLQNFARFAIEKGDQYVTRSSVLEWANLAPSPEQKRNRLLTVRRFAIAINAEDDRHEIPPSDAFGRQCAKRKIRHLFTPQEIKQTMAVASRLSPQNSIRPRTYATLFGLLASSGLRSCEALALDTGDLKDDGLVIRNTKFRKSRIIPLHKSTRAALRDYLSYRLQFHCLESALFISNTGKRLAYSTVISVFLQIIRSIGIRGKPGTPGACLHDLRHTFAVRSLESCLSNREAVSRHMLSLSTYLGHAHISDTYWYLQATQTLLKSIAEAQEACFGRKRND